jgi:hypothetical protein
MLFHGEDALVSLLISPFPAAYGGLPSLLWHESAAYRCEFDRRNQKGLNKWVIAAALRCRDSDRDVMIAIVKTRCRSRGLSVRRRNTKPLS